jgi:hypothetical protein
MGEGETGSKDEIIKYAGELYHCYLRFKPRLESIRDETRRFAVFIGFLNNWFMSRGLGYLVVTGGFAVELVTGSAYRTMDVDVITSDAKVAMILEAFLNMIGERIARGYLPSFEEIAAKSIDIVSTIYARRKKPLTIILDGYKIFLDPPEELIASYLSAWKYWESTVDRDKAIWLIMVLEDKIDWKYLSLRVKKENVEDKLSELLKITKHETIQPDRNMIKTHSYTNEDNEDTPQ